MAFISRNLSINAVPYHFSYYLVSRSASIPSNYHFPKGRHYLERTSALRKHLVKLNRPKKKKNAPIPNLQRSFQLLDHLKSPLFSFSKSYEPFASLCALDLKVDLVMLHFQTRKKIFFRDLYRNNFCP